MSAFEHVVREELELREIVGAPTARSVQKERSTLDQHCRAFIAQSPFVLIATAGADGRCDISPKGDAPRFRARAGRPATCHPRSPRQQASGRHEEHPHESPRRPDLPRAWT